ncbi:type II secretion system protein [Fervidobacterium thailandense]|uniref:type II secretion system protein n=1 Tax=Fervidobacterium thailandense TaxID=1008305 RepID=UPI001F4DF967|nr:type II secretion system protein [Fervidobacterium thailandense]
MLKLYKVETIRKGFTLIELLIVMSIIGALLAVAVPSGLNAVAQAKAVNVASNFRTLHQVVMQMLMLEQNPPTSGDILQYLLEKGYISTKPAGFTITYSGSDRAYLITYQSQDVSPSKVLGLYGPIKLEGGYLVVRVVTQ